MQIRVNLTEKQAFQLAAELDGKKMSEWIRDRLRQTSRREIEQVGLAVPFVTRPGISSKSAGSDLQS